jgi:hypothetical protein
MPNSFQRQDVAMVEKPPELDFVSKLGLELLILVCRFVFDCLSHNLGCQFSLLARADHLGHFVNS